MTMLSSPRRLPHKDVPADAAGITMPDIVAVLQRSNHATAFASWSVTIIATGLVVQANTVRAIASGTAVLLLAALVLPVLATASRAVILLMRAAQAAQRAEVSGTGAASDAATAAPAAADRLSAVAAALRLRDTLARRAQVWAAVSGLAFLAWSLLAVLLPTGG
jgi:hypothetical protein